MGRWCAQPEGEERKATTAPGEVETHRSGAGRRQDGEAERAYTWWGERDEVFGSHRFIPFRFPKGPSGALHQAARYAGGT
jgi:hypothetical protein